MKKSIMWKYINEEPDVLNRILMSGQIKEKINRLEKTIHSIYLVAHGSSYNAANAISNFLSQYANIRVYCYTPAKFLYDCHTAMHEDPEKTLVIAISQTGTSRGTIQAIEKAKELGLSIIGISDAENSPLHALSTLHIKLNCGEEASNAKTKGYSATLLTLLLISIAIAEKQHCINIEQTAAIMNELKASVNELPDIIKNTTQWCETTHFGKNIENIFVLGQGMNFGTALEGQLKIMETMCIPTMFNDIEEFSHGMHRAINQNSSIILLNTEYPCKELTGKTFKYLQSKTDKVIMVNASDTPYSDKNVISIQNHPLTQSIVGITTVIQILSVFIPEINGFDPNATANDDYTDFVHTRISSN